MMLPLRSALLRLHPQYCLQFWDPQYERQMDLILERGQQRATKMIEGLEQEMAKAQTVHLCHC